MAATRAERFDEVHRRLYGFGLEGGAEIVNLRAIAPRQRADAGDTRVTSAGGSDPAEAQMGNADRVDARASGARCRPTSARGSTAGHAIPGHAIVEQYDATTVVLPGHVAEVDP